ncbi:SCF ubiquitin ligase complex subunit DAS1 KNAG_0C02540 [Huiozyma naganishii CBS 8797]|uniref:F-box domain-containing protein n=1 Tax=Huiozyma naganishii (strain ATCC MYA-139 / BCRC 22969 / CBS 8797 / KCTC 17520 / NBRC 10181 / NCYC 3082 / Yp74L-3) TaxID=1071383 RepID=J7R3F7_HUIN7|nr:hypothetical protein KNAG_0C02540 [Kazachstania naganishii CBS 8797]CCK69365.1 hypothetical protein KNAG_0C02540 [Kazachstania naganishii CBS 8797]
MSREFPMNKLPRELLHEIVSHLSQQDRLNCALVSRKWYKVATKIVYRRIYLNDSNVVRSDFMNVAINWTLLNIPSFLNEDESRDIANSKLRALITTFENNEYILNSVEWIRINWDLDSLLQKKILKLLCDKAQALKRLENVTDPSCNDIIASGRYSRDNLTSFDMAPPNSLPELAVPPEFIPNLIDYLDTRISTHLSHMTLFIDPLKLFNYLYHLREKLTIVDLKLHWRREFYAPEYFEESKLRSPELRRLTDVFDVRALKTLTIISWNESLMSREMQMLKEFKDFVHLEDLSLISIKQDIDILVELFENLKNLKRLKMDFLEDYIPETTSPRIFLTILFNCQKLQFIDIRFEGIDTPVINMNGNKFELEQKCHCANCTYAFNEILRAKIFVFPIDYYLTDIQDIAAKDIFKMMRYLSLLPYSKACDCYPSVRTQPMNMNEFVKKMNENLVNYRQHRNQLLKVPREDPNPGINDTWNAADSDPVHTAADSRPVTLQAQTVLPQLTTTQANRDEFEQLDIILSSTILNQRLENKLERLPHDPLTKSDVIHLYHLMIHHFKNTYVTFLKGFPELRFLMLNDIPTIAIEENTERIFHPIFYHDNYESNLGGWTKQPFPNNVSKGTDGDDTVTRRATFI